MLKKDDRVNLKMKLQLDRRKSRAEMQLKNILRSLDEYR
jgi:hypothetical protein